MKIRILVVVMLLSVLTSGAMGQVQRFPDHERFLIPVYTEVELPGAHGSRWVSILSGWNNGDEEALLMISPEPCLQVCLDKRLPPKAPFTSFVLSDPGKGALLWLRPPAGPEVKFQLRIQDVSRQAQTWGTEIPVVRVSEAFVGELILLDVPIHERFRTALRIYDMIPELRSELVRVEIYEADAGGTSAPVVTEDLRYTYLKTTTQFSHFHYPGEVQIHDLVARYPQLAGKETVRIRITTLDERVRFWAFASITNNETQHVTTVTPM